MKLFPIFASLAAAAQVAPFLMASHRLVPGLRDEIGQNLLEIQDSSLVVNMAKKLVTECSSDLYLLVNVPGLKNSDMVETRKTLWPHLRNYLHMASSLVALPWVENGVDLDFLEKYIVRTCKAESIRSAGDVEQYIDTRTRVIRYDASLSGDRAGSLKEVDEAIRRILRISPSPHYTIIVTSEETDTFHHIPEFALEANPEFFQLFNDIVNHSTRAQEYERNSFMYNDVEPHWNEGYDPAQLYMNKKKADEVHFWDERLWKENEKVIMTVLLMALSLCLFESVTLVLWGRKRLERKIRTQ